MMVAAARWVRHDRKRPVRPDGSPASSTDPATWSTLARAERGTAGSGLGFVLGDGIACLDLDHCLDARGRVAAWAVRILDSVPGAYVEVSPGGDGLHVWGTAPPGKGSRRSGVEAYSAGRFITVTRRVFRAGDLVDLSSFF